MLETSLSAVARVRSFERDTPNENQPQESMEPSSDWPQNGEVELHNVNVSYKLVNTHPFQREANKSSKAILLSSRTFLSRSVLAKRLVFVEELEGIT